MIVRTDILIKEFYGEILLGKISVKTDFFTMIFSGNMTPYERETTCITAQVVCSPFLWFYDLEHLIIVICIHCLMLKNTFFILCMLSDLV